MSLKIDQAFVSEFINGAFGLPIAHENLPYTPTTNIAYAQLKNLPNDITGYSLNDTNLTDGVFRIYLNYPVNTGSIQAKTKAHQIMDYFRIGSKVDYQGQSATIRAVQRQPGAMEGNWYQLIVDIFYVAKLER